MVIQKNISLHPYHSLGCMEVAAYFATISKKEDLLACVAFSKQQQIPLRIIGSGTNILFSSNDNSLIAKMEITGIKKVEEDANTVRLAVGAGENWHHFVSYCVQKSWGGIENLSFIPGTVGACSIQNIYAYGVEVRECIHIITAFDKHTSKWVKLNPFDCAFEYSSSIFQKEKDRYIITEVEFKLAKQPTLRLEDGALREALYHQGILQPNIASIALAIIQERTHTLPVIKKQFSAGKCFHNPIASKEQITALRDVFPDLLAYPISDKMYKIEAEWMILKAGWVKATQGPIECFSKNPLYIIKQGNCSGKEIDKFIQEMEQSILKQFGIRLQRSIEKL
jgi:UDP-N-acetylmuramate dehydrogenase